MDEIKIKLRKFIADGILYSSKGFPYGDGASFLENGIVDSMNIMEIVMYVENQFDIKVEDEDIVPENFDSINQLAEFILRKKSQAVA